MDFNQDKVDLVDNFYWAEDRWSRTWYEHRGPDNPNTPSLEYIMKRIMKF